MSNDEPAAVAAIDEPILSPVKSGERYSSIDVVRGMALFGILLMNIIGFAHGRGYSEFRGEGLAEGANFWSWAIMSTFFEGTQRTLFSLLFGAGVIILTSRAEQRGGGISVADIYYRRNIWLIGFGLVDSYLLLWTGDILYIYGLVALFLFPLRNLQPRQLLMIGFLAIVAQFGNALYDVHDVRSQHAEYTEAQAAVDAGEKATEEQENAIKAWEKKLENYEFDREKYAERVENMTTSFATAFEQLLPFQTKIHGNIAFRYLFLDIVSMMVIGMAFFKLGILTLDRSTRFYWLMLLAGYGVGLPVSFWETYHLVSHNFDLLPASVTWLTYDIGRLGNATGHLALLLLFVRSGWLSSLQERIAAVGRTALSNYILHSIIAMFVFTGAGLGLYGFFERYELYHIVLLIVLIQLLISKPWIEKYRFGPLEWVWRSLTYMRRPPMRRQ